MIRLALVGCGEIATAAHLPALQILQREGLVDVTTCDADPNRAQAAATQFGFRHGEHWEDTAADAVAICVPPGPNAELAIAALGHGLHVLCEKPPGRTETQAAAMAQAAASRPDLITMVAFNRRFSPLYRRAADRASRLGAPRSFFGRFLRAEIGNEPSNTATDWITSDSCHALDLAIATMGFPSSVAVERSVVGTGPDNVWSIQLHTPGGAAQLMLNYAAGRRAETYEWAGPGYDVRIVLPKSAEWAQSGRNIEQWSGGDEGGSSEYATVMGFEGEYRALLAAIRGDGPRPECDFRYGHDFMRLVRVVLDAPSGASVAVEAPAPAPEVATVKPQPAAQARARSRSSNRPLVVIQQSVPTQQRFFSEDKLTELRARCDLRTWVGDDELFDEAHIVVTGRGAKPLPGDFASRAADLELLVVVGASVGNFHAADLIARGVHVTNTAAPVASVVAEHCLLLSLAGLRRLTQLDRAMHKGEWPVAGAASRRGSAKSRIKARVMALPLPESTRRKIISGASRGLAASSSLRPNGVTASVEQSEAPGSSDLRGQIVGLIGWGHVARHFAKLLVPFGCDVRVCSDTAPAAELEALGVQRADLGEILASSRVVSLHKGLTESTRGLLDADRLNLLRPGTVLVNTARGPLIDEAALVERLQRGDIVAALDVYDEEPLPKAHPLRGLDNVVLTPHRASATIQEERRMGDHALATIEAWLEGEPVDGIDAARLSRMT